MLPKPELLVTQAASKFNEQGHLTDESTNTVYATLLAKFVTWIQRLRIMETV